MRIWIDLGNSPHVPFFRALSGEFEKRGHELLWTARDYAQTVELAREAGLDPFVCGRHGGKRLFNKGFRFGSRILGLLRWAAGKRIGLAVSHNSHEPFAVARTLGIRSVTLMDYEHHPANRLSFRLADRVIVPESFPDEFLREFGAERKSVKFEGIKEDVYLADFTPDPAFRNELRGLGVSPEHILVVVRPHAPEALYHRNLRNEILREVLERCAARGDVRVILLPRKENQARELRAAHPQENIIIPDRVLDGPNLIAASDLIVSGGGTMNREAAALGVPAATIFAGHTAAVDEYLFREGLLRKIETPADLDRIELKKKPGLRRRDRRGVRERVAELILGA